MISYDITEKNVEELIKHGIIILDFYADWCGPCKMLGPELEELVKKNKDINIYKINVDKSPELARAYGVMSIPTLILYKNGLEVGKTLGFRPMSELDSWIEKSN